MSNNNKFNSIQVGDKSELFHEITESDVETFVRLTGDNNRIHIDKEYSKNTSFKKPIVHGMLGASFISTVIGTKLPGDGAVWFSQTLEFLLPVRVGEKIKVCAEVIKKIDSDQILEIQTEIFNEHNQKVTTGLAKVKLVEPEIKEEVESKKEVSKVALILGGSGGIGRETAIRLSNDGFRIILHYHSNKESAEEIKNLIQKAGGEALLVKADLRNETSISNLFREIERVHDSVTVFVNAVTLPIINTSFSDLEWDSIENHFNLNIKSTFFILKNIVPLMKKVKYGKIVNLTTQAIDSPITEWLHYITAKSALSGFSKALALELAPYGIRVNLVSPGMTDTDLLAHISEKAKLLTVAKTPLRKIASPKDVANAIAFLCGPDSDHITGETIRINGGMVII